MDRILNIAGYKFVPLSDLETLRAHLIALAEQHALKGTFLLSDEGINVNLAGIPENITTFLENFFQDTRFSDMIFKESYSDFQPFNQLKVKVKNEIITLRQSDIHPEKEIAPTISPRELKQWLDEKRDITLLDTRNDYEVQFGTFKNAIHLQLKNFGEFPEAATKNISHEKPIVMFCTGGIRCEKAAWVLLNAGYSDVYQLDGGILNYFAEVGAAHYDGDCYVFDQRIALNPALQISDKQQCVQCQGPVQAMTQHICDAK